MAQYSILKNQPLNVHLLDDYIEQGWVVSGSIAYHSGCNSGYIRHEFDLSTNDEWTFEYTILSLTTGTVRIEVGNQLGTTRSAAGTYTDTFTVNDPDTIVRFFATGITSLQLLKVYPQEEFTEGLTFMFNEDADKWTTYYSYVPEFMVKFINSFMSFQSGTLWEHNVNETRNNFYGVQYNTKVRFICNVNFKEDKLFFNLRLDSRGAWFSPYMATAESDQFPNGMESQLKKNNFSLIDGKLWADILHDMNDPNFATVSDPVERKLKGLFNGRQLQGAYLTVELENSDTTEATLSSVEVYYTETKRGL